MPSILEREIFQGTKDTTIILGSAFLWAPFMQQTQTIRYGVQSKIIELLGTGKMRVVFAWVAGSATQASSESSIRRNRTNSNRRKDNIERFLRTI